MTTPSSLEKVFSRQIARWSFIGLLGTALIALLLIFHLGVTTTEERLRVTADAAVKAFRPQMLTLQDSRQIELQIRDAFHLDNRESAVIRSADFKRKYELGASSSEDLLSPSCHTPERVCWQMSRFQVSTVVPIFFDNKRESLFGYLELNLIPHFDLPLLLGLFISICAGSLIQAIGLSSRFVRLASSVGGQLNLWADHIRRNPKAPIAEQNFPYEDLRPLGDALSGLTQEIERLETQARDSAKLSIIRGIGHDILSPVSQIQNHMKTLGFYAKEGRPAPEEITLALQRALKRLTAIAQQTKLLQPGATMPSGFYSLNLASETSAILDDLKKDAEIEAKKVDLSHAKSSSAGVFAQIPSEDYLRILDNLVRNAIHATPAFGKVEITTGMDGEYPMVRISDCGSGIPAEIQSRIFDLDFTTRPGLGTGLGLSIVKQLCERNEAAVSFRSEVGVGTEFTIRFRPGRVLSPEVAAV